MLSNFGFRRRCGPSTETSAVKYQPSTHVEWQCMLQYVCELEGFLHVVVGAGAACTLLP